MIPDSEKENLLDYKDSVELFLAAIDGWRTNELYPHPVCSGIFQLGPFSFFIMCLFRWLRGTRLWSCLHNRWFMETLISNLVIPCLKLKPVKYST